MADSSVYLRDYQHASKTFRSNLYQNAPKFKFLFHVYFDINPEAYSQNTSTGSNFGILVKTVKLPSYTFSVAELNQYNRKRVVQTKVKYDPIDITFHDDNRNLINSLWISYFNYYYKDSSNPKVAFNGAAGQVPGVKPPADYNIRNQYDPATTEASGWNWGFYGDTNAPYGLSSKKIPFFKNITVFGMEQHNFTAYTLINPIITRFSHDTYNYAEGGGTMENSMTLEYETVVYNQGQIDGQKPENIITGFGDPATYDRTLSPIAPAGSNSQVIGQTGMMESIGGAVTAFNNAKTGADYASALQKMGITPDMYSGLNLSGPVTPAITAAVREIIFNAANSTRQRSVDIPVYGQSPTPLTTNAGVNVAYDIRLNPDATTQPTAGQQQTPPV